MFDCCNEWGRKVVCPDWVFVSAGATSILMLLVIAWGAAPPKKNKKKRKRLNRAERDKGE